MPQAAALAGHLCPRPCLQRSFRSHLCLGTLILFWGLHTSGKTWKAKRNMVEVFCRQYDII